MLLLTFAVAHADPKGVHASDVLGTNLRGIASRAAAMEEWRSCGRTADAARPARGGEIATHICGSATHICGGPPCEKVGSLIRVQDTQGPLPRGRPASPDMHRRRWIRA
jgi:hypothetical protein